jgi:transglutaminase-like putative cysteine protease
MVTPSIINATEIKKTKNGRIFVVNNSFDLIHETQKANYKLWVPIPFDSDYQVVGSLSYNGNYDKSLITNKNEYGAKTLYGEWNSNQEDKKLDLTFSVATTERQADLSRAKSTQNYSNEVKKYLASTAHINVTPKVKELANKITLGAKTPLDKVHKIYLFVTDTMYRDNSVKGCGLGDASKAIENNLWGGKCTDISSVFVALVRAVGIPAREVFGIRLGSSRYSKAFGKSDANGLAKISGGQHCRAEFYIDGIGWTPADPADVTKILLQDKLEKTDKRYLEVKEYFFGNWEMNWVGFNSARDFVLNPEPTQKPLNMFGYPYAEVDDEVLDYYVPQSFNYKYTSNEKL